MVTLVVHHWVRDFAAWKPVFDEHADVRRSHGEVEHRIYQDIYNPNRVVIHNDFPSEQAARSFMTDPSLPEAMELSAHQFMIQLKEKAVSTVPPNKFLLAKFMSPANI